MASPGVGATVTLRVPLGRPLRRLGGITAAAMTAGLSSSSLSRPRLSASSASSTVSSSTRRGLFLFFFFFSCEGIVVVLRALVLVFVYFGFAFVCTCAEELAYPPPSSSCDAAATLVEAPLAGTPPPPPALVILEAEATITTEAARLSRTPPTGKCLARATSGCRIDTGNARLFGLTFVRRVLPPLSYSEPQICGAVGGEEKLPRVQQRAPREARAADAIVSRAPHTPLGEGWVACIWREGDVSCPLFYSCLSWLMTHSTANTPQNTVHERHQPHPLWDRFSRKIARSVCGAGYSTVLVGVLGVYLVRGFSGKASQVLGYGLRVKKKKNQKKTLHYPPYYCFGSVLLKKALFSDSRACRGGVQSIQLQ